MSRIGRLPIAVPATVDVTIDGRTLTVKGPKGVLTRSLHPDMILSREESQLVVTRPTEQKTHKQLHGLTRTLVNNMVVGVTDGYRKGLEITGVGYRAALNGRKLQLNLGYSHPIEIDPPEGISFEVETPTRLAVVGIDKELVGQIAANVLSTRKPEPYTDKGVRYSGEVIRRKAGKDAVKGVVGSIVDGKHGVRGAGVGYGIGCF
jgi:large subunit ribosomal protein L6